MQILKYMLGVILVLLAASPSFAYKTLDDLDTFGASVCYVTADGKDSKEGDCLSETLKSLKPGMWGMPMLDGKDQLDLVGNTACVDYRGKQGNGEAADNQSYFDKMYDDGPYCYCQMTGPETSSWMFSEEYKDYKTCNASCAVVCADWIGVDESKIRTNMFKTVNYGGVDYSWLYDTTGTKNRCFVGPDGKFFDESCPSGTDKIITEPRQWAAVLDSKEHPETLVTGTAWVSNKIDTKAPKLGYIPTTPAVIQDINDEYASYKSGDNPYGQYCYCKMETPGESSWVLLSAQGGYLQDCTADCAVLTSKRGSGSEATTLTDAMFSTLKSAAGGMSVVVTTNKYVDNLLDAKQARITDKGQDKLMTYGASTGATPGSRDIVSTLGTSTSATSVPEVGPIVAGINSKQNAVNGTANNVMTRTGTAGIMNSKPVYSATNNYSNALITAGTINTAVATAANGELYCARFVDGAPQTDANCLLWGMNTTAPAGMDISRFWVAEPTIHSPYGCTRRLIGGNGDSNIACNVDTLSYLGASGNKSGKWSIAFPYGDISGISVCSAVSASGRGTIATDAQSATLDSEYAAQAGVGESALATNQTYCWCKMENPGVSRWIFTDHNSNAGAGYCATNCATLCLIRSDVTLRSAMFGSVTQ